MSEKSPSERLKEEDKIRFKKLVECKTCKHCTDYWCDRFEKHVIADSLRDCPRHEYVKGK